MSLLTSSADIPGSRRKAVARLIGRFHERGLAALDDLPGSGHPPSSGPTQRARLIQELRRRPLGKEDGTATWHLPTLQPTLPEAPNGLPMVVHVDAPLYDP